MVSSPRSGPVGAADDPWRKLAALRAEATLVRSHATELEQLGLTLSGRDVDSIDHSDLVSYVIWISQFTSQATVVLAHWGFAMAAYLDGALRAAGVPPTSWTPPTDDQPATPVVSSRPRRWWRRCG
jgi:hypothetical protein